MKRFFKGLLLSAVVAITFVVIANADKIKLNQEDVTTTKGTGGFTEITLFTRNFPDGQFSLTRVGNDRKNPKGSTNVGNNGYITFEMSLEPHPDARGMKEGSFIFNYDISGPAKTKGTITQKLSPCPDCKSSMVYFRIPISRGTPFDKDLKAAVIKSCDSNLQWDQPNLATTGLMNASLEIKNVKGKTRVGKDYNYSQKYYFFNQIRFKCSRK